MAGLPVNSSLDQNHAVLGVHVLSVERKVLVDGDCLFHEVEEIFRDLWGEVCLYDKDWLVGWL